MFSYVIHPSRQRIDVHVGALTSGVELVDGMKELLSDPAFDPTSGIMIDLRELERAPSIAEIADLASFVRERAVAQGARRAFVTSSPAFYQAAVLFTRLAKGAVAKFRVFRSADDAERWLAAGSTHDPSEE